MTGGEKVMWSWQITWQAFLPAKNCHSVLLVFTGFRVPKPEERRVYFKAAVWQQSTPKELLCRSVTCWDGCIASCCWQVATSFRRSCSLSYLQLSGHEVEWPLLSHPSTQGYELWTSPPRMMEWIKSNLIYGFFAVWFKLECTSGA